ncbi:MAG: ABC transporter ATP-binding protein [Candidatus Jacksonbacteria bacterium]|nr:ABC transporter ATP-binding protein [Candidatus Jacksonbacteria bacterium]
MDPIIKIQNVNVVYNAGEGSREMGALSDITIDIYPKEYIVFFGPSGCGKSTLLNVIAGLERVASGRVLVAGRDLTTLTDEELATYHRHEIGFIFQAYNLIGTLSVVENIALPQMFDGVSKREWYPNAYKMAERFGIAEHAKKLPQELSGGQQQRVGITRALINNPAIVLADEPTGNLDSKNVRRVLDIFQELNLKEGKTVVLVTHSPDMLGEADRIVYLRDGKIVDEVQNKERRLLKPKTEEEKKLAAGGDEPASTETVFPWKRFLRDAYVPASVKSEKLAEFVLGVPPEEKIARMETLIEKRLQGIMSAEDLVASLDRSYYRGGAGFDKRRAKRLGEYTEHVLKVSGAIKKLITLPEDEQQNITAALSENLIGTLNLTLGEDQKKILDNLLKDRFANRVGPNEIKKILDAPLSKGGIGLRRQTAQRVMEYIELTILVASKT